MLTYTYPHKPLMAPFTCGLRLALVICKQRKREWFYMYTTPECPYRDQASIKHKTQLFPISIAYVWRKLRKQVWAFRTDMPEFFAIGANKTHRLFTYFTKTTISHMKPHFSPIL